MGHALGDQARKAVDKSKATEAKKARTDEQIFRDIEINLNAGLSIPPNDVRLLLQKYRSAEAAVAHLAQSTTALLKRAELTEAKLVIANEGLTDEMIGQAAEDLGKSVANMMSEGGNGN
jgi:hypothetical protein